MGIASCFGSKQVTPLFLSEAGNTPHDNPPEPFSTSKTSNWVARAGGLPPYIQHVAHAMVEKGKPTSKAISMAVGIVRNWAEGKGGVHPAIKAAAAKAIAEWEAKRAKSRASSTVKKAASATVSERVADSYLLLQNLGEEVGGEALAEMLAEAKLDSKARNKLPSSSFAIPEKRAYPIHDESHARNALARAAGKPEEGRVRAAVKKRYPKMGKTEEELDIVAAEGDFYSALQGSAALVEAAPSWMMPVAARRPGFRPSNPEKRKGISSGSGSFNANKHARAPKGSGVGGRFIEMGATGREVSAVQRRLGVSETGTYSGSTKSRVERFQRNHGLQVDGVVGAQTVAAMRGNTSVAPGALTKNDRRYLRRYTARTSSSSSRRVVRPRHIVTR